MAKRTSKFRHIYGEESKPEGHFQELKNPVCSGEGSYVKANAKFFAVARSAGGGPMYICSLNAPGRLAANVPMVSVNKGKVWDFDFHPFVSNIIATGSDDTHVAVAQFPAGGLEDNVTDAMIDMQGHQKKVILVTWNPVANNILATGSFDRTVKVWNVETGEALSTFDGLADNIYSLEWNRNGSLLACSSKDKKLRIFDPRNKEQVSEIAEAFDGAKSSKIFFVPEFQWVGATGFSKSAKRQLKLWDQRKLEEPLFKLDIDAAASVLMPQFDTDNGVLYLAGKGDGTIQFYELVNDDRQVYFLNQHRGEPQKGGGWVPKRGLDVWKCEVNRFLKLTKTSIIPVSFIVPRKAGSEVFQDDIYPDAPAAKAALTADQWAGGENADPVLTTLDPAKRQDQDEQAAPAEKKATYAELMEENKKLKAALAAAKAELAQLKGGPAADEKEEEEQPQDDE
jgi:hypothetical protein